jgi:hypothetical protein
MSGRLPNALELIIGDYQAIFITVYYIEKPKPTEPQNVFFCTWETKLSDNAHHEKRSSP